MAEMIVATGWQLHTVHGAPAASVNKKLGARGGERKAESQEHRLRIRLIGAASGWRGGGSRRSHEVQPDGKPTDGERVGEPNFEARHRLI